MSDYLNVKFDYNDNFVITYDELPLWSAGFGLLLLENIDLKDNIKILDIGCGTGFPTFEIAQRFGRNCKIYALDIWKEAVNRAKLKIQNYAMTNVEIIESDAANIPLKNGEIDLAISNLGINNFQDINKTLKEIYRILDKNGTLVITTNIKGYFDEFYKIYKKTLIQLDKKDKIQKLNEHIERRGTIKTIKKIFRNNGFGLRKIVKKKLYMRFYNGTSLLNHYFIKLSFLDGWKSILTDEENEIFFAQLEENLNEYSKIRKCLKLTVPMLYLEFKRNRKAVL